MRKETIIKYEKEFMAWVKGEEVLVGAPSSMEDASKGILSWRQVKDFADWNALDTKYVLNDSYSIYRKALVEGKTIEEFIDNGWTNMYGSRFSGDKNKYRIKPYGPKFKVGDWVLFTQKLNTVPMKITKVNTREIVSEGNFDFLYGIGCNLLKLWQPKAEEWAWFGYEIVQVIDNSDTIKICRQDSDAYEEVTLDKLEPFIGTLPSFIESL